MRTRRQRKNSMMNFGTNSTSTMSNAKEVLKVQKKLEGKLETDKPEPAPVTKKTHNIRFMDHCFFCVRKTTTNYSKDRNYNTDLVDKLEEIPSADDSLSLDTSLLCTLNKTWAYLLQGGNWNWASDSNNMIAQFTRLPKMWRFCAEELVTISRLMCELIAEINRLGKVMRDSRYGGVHSWRVDRFEQTLRNSGVDQGSIRDTLRFLGKPDVEEAVWATNSQPGHENIDEVEGESQREDNSDNNDGDNGGRESDDSHNDPSYIKEDPICSSENEDPDDAVEEGQEEYQARINDDDDSEAKGSSVIASNYQTTFDPVTGKRMFQCTINNCGQKYARIYPVLQHHQRMVHNFDVVRRPCDLCRALVPPEKIIEHVRAHVGDDYLLKCPNPDCCHLAFCTIPGLSKHRKFTKSCKRITSEWEQFDSLKQICELCDGKDFETIKMLRHHILNFHETDEKIFPCPIQTCQKKFSVKQSVFLHLALHDEDNDIYPEPVQNCDVCQAKVNLEEMEQHLKDSHSLKDVVKCVFCPFLFASREDLVEHVYLHRHSCDMYCDICGADEGPTFSVHAELRQHYFQVHQIGSLYNCELCPAQLISSWALEHHMNKQHIAVNDDCSDPNKVDNANEKLGAPQQGPRGLVRKFACKEPGCRKFFIREVNLNRHIASAHNNNGVKKSYFCEKCGKSFSNNQSLTIHLKWHQGKLVRRYREFKCQVPGCDKVVSKKSALAEHVTVKHNREKPHVCEECGKAYGTKHSLRFHVQSVHLNLHSTVCDICGRGFTHKTQLENHKWSHTDERPFSCHICGKGFRQKKGLQVHLKLAKCFPGSYDKHRKKTFTCQVPGCGKEFLRNDRLQQHVSWVHEKEQSNVCDQCGKAFETKTALKTHVQSVHVGVRNHVCDVCGESFSYGSVLKHHKLIHTGDRPFACQICGQKFRHKEVLNRHVKGHERKGAQFKPNGPMKQVRKRVVKKQTP